MFVFCVFTVYASAALWQQKNAVMSPNVGRVPVYTKSLLAPITVFLNLDLVNSQLKMYICKYVACKLSHH